MGTRDERPRIDLFKWTLVAVCAILALIVILLARQNRQLKQERLARPALELGAGDRLGG